MLYSRKESLCSLEASRVLAEEALPDLRSLRPEKSRRRVFMTGLSPAEGSEGRGGARSTESTQIGLEAESTPWCLARLASFV